GGGVTRRPGTVFRRTVQETVRRELWPGSASRSAGSAASNSCAAGAFRAAGPAADADTTGTVAVPLTPPALALSLYRPPVRRRAVYSPVRLRLPLPVSVQVNAGCAARAAPNWSRAVALNCSRFPTPTFAVAGLTTIDVTFCATVTPTLLARLLPAA